MNTEIVGWPQEYFSDFGEVNTKASLFVGNVKRSDKVMKVNVRDNFALGLEQNKRSSARPLQHT